MLWFFSYSIQCIWQHVYKIVNRLSAHRDGPRLCHKFHLILLLVWLKYALYSRFIACKCNANKLLHAPDPQSSYNILQLSLPRWHVGHWLVLHENYEVNVHSTAYIPFPLHFATMVAAPMRIQLNDVSTHYITFSLQNKTREIVTGFLLHVSRILFLFKCHKIQVF